MTIYNPKYKNQFHCLPIQYILWDIVSLIFIHINKKHLFVKFNEKELYYKDIIYIFGAKKAAMLDYDNREYVVFFNLKK